MANTKHINPTLPIKGYRAEVATLTPGVGVIQGTAEDQVTLAGANATIKGIVALDQQLPPVGSEVAIHIGHGGPVYVQAGAAFANNALLTTDADGQFITCVATNKVLAKALAAASAAGELIPAIVYPPEAAVAP